VDRGEPGSGLGLSPLIARTLARRRRYPTVRSETVRRRQIIFGAAAMMTATGAVLATAAASPKAPARGPTPSAAAVTTPRGEPSPTPQERTPEWGRDFYFTRAIYSGSRGFRRGGSWAIDFPKADRQFLFVLHRLLTRLDLYDSENPVSLADPELRRYPFLYMLEVGGMSLTDPEVKGLHDYLEAGGFLVVDDFWGSRALANFEYEMSRVLPDRKIREIPMDHRIFHQFYDIDEILQVPNIGNGMRGPPYEECYGCAPRVFGIFNDRDELMVVVNWNTDLGDAWEWSENPYYPIDRSNFAYELAINYIIYGLSH